MVNIELDGGLALALPDKVPMARPAGVGSALTAYDMPVEEPR